MMFRTQRASTPDARGDAAHPTGLISSRSLAATFASAYRDEAEVHTDMSEEAERHAMPVTAQETEKNGAISRRSPAGNDEVVEAACEVALQAYPGEIYKNVQAFVSAGRVMLLGTVASGAERWAAEVVVSAVAGVTGVNSQITVKKVLPGLGNPHGHHIQMK